MVSDLKLKNIIGRAPYVRTLHRVFTLLRQQYGLNIFKWVFNLTVFLYEYSSYLRCEKNPHFDNSLQFLYPCLTDRTDCTPIDPTYFYQDTWAAGKIFRLKPMHHYDVGSSAMSIGLISQFVPTTMIDIRPISLALDNLHFKQGSILALPFEDDSLESLSSLCVLEHIGLGRYGDPIDSMGTERAASELRRVLRKGGHLLISLPVDEASRVYFNAHRAFTRQHVMDLFACLTLVEERYIYGGAIESTYDPNKGFGTGLFHFRK